VSDDFTRYRALLAARVRHGAGPEAIREARRGLAAAKVRRVVDAERARLGLPPAGDELAAVVTGAAFLEAA
jgi:hypothetical protein